MTPVGSGPGPGRRVGFEDPAFYTGDPDPDLAGLRRSRPLHQEGDGLWVLTRHEDVSAVGRDPGRFISSLGVLLADRNREVAAADSILYLDPPAHTHYRKLVSRAFTPRTVGRLEPIIRRLARELLDSMDPARECDLVDGLAAPLPILVMAELLGIPAADRHDFRRWSAAGPTPSWPPPPSSPMRMPPRPWSCSCTSTPSWPSGSRLRAMISCPLWSPPRWTASA